MGSNFYNISVFTKDKALYHHIQQCIGAYADFRLLSDDLANEDQKEADILMLDTRSGRAPEVDTRGVPVLAVVTNQPPPEQNLLQYADFIQEGDIENWLEIHLKRLIYRSKEQKRAAIKEDWFQEAPAAFFILDSRDKIYAWNTRMEELTNYKEEEVIGRVCTTIFQPYQGQELIQKETGEYSMFYTLQTQDGMHKYFYKTLKPFQRENFSGYLGTVQDISSYVENNLALKYTSLHFQNVWDNADEAIFIVQENHIRYFNKRFKRMLGVKEEEIQNKSVDSLFKSDEQPVSALHKKIKENSATYTSELEVRLNTAEHRERYARIKMQYADWYGSPAILNFLTEITRQKQQAQEKAYLERIINQIFEFSSVAMRFINSNHTIVLCNKKYKELNASYTGPVIGGKCDQFFNSGQCETIYCPVESVQNSNEYLQDEVEIDVNGETRHYRYNAMPVVSEEKGFEGIIESFTDITENKRTELELRKFEIIAEQNPIGIVITDTSGLIQYVNKKVIALTGYSKAELIGKTPAVWKSGRHSDAFYKDFWETIKAGYTWQGRFENRSKDGSLYFAKSLVAPLKNEKGEIVSFIALKEDITKREKVEHELKENQRQYQLIAASIHDVIITLDLGFSIDFATPSLERFLGYKPEELTGIAFTSLLDEESKALFQKTRAYIMNLLSDGNQVPQNPAPTELEMKFVTKSGGVKWGETQFSFTRSENNKFIGIQAVTRDISDKKLIEQENLRNEANKNALLNNNQQAFILLDKKRNILSFNERAREFTQQISGELLKGYTSLDAYFSKDTLEDFQKHIEIALTGIVAGQDKDFHLKGQTVWFSCTYNPVKDANGEITGVSLGMVDITKRKQVEQKLKESERFFRIIADYTYNWELFRNPKGDIVYSSPKFEELTGYTTADYYAGKISMHDFIAQEDIEQALNGLRKAMEGETLNNHEFRIVHKDGTIRHASIDAHPVILPDNQFYGIRASVRDITEKKKADIALQKSKEEFQSMFENVPVALYRISNKGEILMANSALIAMLNYSTFEELKQGYYHDSLRKQKLTTRRKFIKEIESKGEVRNYKAVWFTREGKKVFIKENAKAIRNENGQTLYYEGSAENITHQLEAQKREREFNRMFRFLSLSAIDLITQESEADIYRYVGEHLSRFIRDSIIGVYHYDKGSNSLKINRLYGLPAEMKDRMKQQIGYCLFENDFSLNEGFLKNLLSGKLTFMNYGLQVFAKNNQPQQLIQSLEHDFTVDQMYLIGLSRGEELYAGIFIFTRNGRDIRNPGFAETFIRQASIALQRKLMERQLLVEKERAEYANRAKSEFLANMSHEIRTPMNAVLGFAELLQGSNLDENQQQYLSSIHSSGKTLLNLINDILDMSKIEAGKLTIKPEPIYTENLLKEVKQVFQLKIRQKGIDLHTTKTPEVPQQIKVDEFRMRQVLLNLVGNAVKFTEQGSVSLTLSAENLNPSKQTFDLVLQVKDTGIGISEEYQDAIFEAFSQQDAQSTRKYAGTGLGLAITKKLVEIMNGTISLESTYQQGSTFTVHLRDVEIAKSTAVEKENESRQWKFYRFETARILVVDDVESNRNLMKGFMEKAGLEVLLAGEGNRAIALASKHLPSLIFLDIRMPGMNGYDILKILRAGEQTANIPVIAVTASVMKHKKKEIQKAGFDGYIQKPVSSDEVFVHLERFIAYSYYGGDAQEALQNTKKEDEISLQEKALIPELIAILEDEYFPKLEQLLKTKSLKAIRAFAGELVQLAKTYPVGPLINYSDQLFKSTQRFDVLKIEHSLKDFSNMLEKLKAYNGR